ncbi:MAG: response regulator [Desmonostoc vinosum HA7617-LM4]|jgi:diguanylate cyclase (GGDEF)-like protein|nr:response regulator [Desmonostoc vinosum HA7617-LM4]
MRILLLEDDKVLVDVLLKSLTHQHYIVDAVNDGQTGWEYAQSGNYELILMDVGLPLLDGISLCQRLRSGGYSTPILLMTAKDAIADRIRGLDAGADDYLSKPLDLGELQARIRALSRRKEVAPTAVLQVGELSLNPGSCEVSYQEKPVKLTPKEYNLLELFLRNPSRVFTRTQIIDHLWNFDDEPPLEESVKAHIKGLRQKLKKAGVEGWIENVYGLGYRLNPQSQSTHFVEQKYQGSVNEMWQQYQHLMANRLAVLQSAVAAVQTQTLSPELRKSAGHEAHKLAGVLGMFEREAGTKLAREIEQLLSAEGTFAYNQLPSLVGELNNLLALSSTDTELQIEARLLLIDSDQKIGAELQQLAQSAGTSWYQVKDLKSAAEWLQNHLPDLVVLSIDPDSQWQESLTLIADLAARTPSVPVLVLSAADHLANRVTVARAGGAGFLVKPFGAGQIWTIVCQLLRRNRSLAVRVLVVDDDPMFLSALRPLLEPWGIRMTGLQNPQHFWEVLQSEHPDLLILDVEMPQIGGIELCQAVRTAPSWQELPILFLTARSDKETIQQVFAAGADDYITKPVIGPELLTRITNRLERNRLLRAFSTKDSQTGISNYHQSTSDLENLLHESETNGSPVCLAILQVVQLQQFNIQYGHTVGSQILQRWGRLLQSVFRGGEVLGYWGNGEFIIGLPGLNKTEAGDRLSEILTILRQQIFTAPDNSRFQVSCDWTIAEYPKEGLTIQSLYQTANIIAKTPLSLNPERSQRAK